MLNRLLLLLCCLPLMGCVSANAPYEEHDALAAMASCPSVTVYYPDGAGNALPLTRVLPWETDMATALLDTLSAPPEGLPAAVPKEVSFQVTLEKGTATVNVLGLPVFDTPAEESSAVQCIAKTVLALPEVTQVALLFDGERLVRLKHGTEVLEVFFDE